MNRHCVFLIFSLFFTFVWSASVFSSKAEIDEAAYSYGGKIQCGKLTCPNGSAGCFLSKKSNSSNPKIVDVTRRCVDKNGASVFENEDHFEAKNGEQYDIYAQAGSLNYDGDNFNYGLPGYLEEQMQRLREQFKSEYW